MQKKIQEEIQRVQEATGQNDFTYDMMNELKYLECCIYETLRKYPTLPIHIRTVTQDYKVPDSKIVIPKGTSITIPVLGFHRDPDIYENPMEFKPERFLDSPNGGGKISGLFYTPFGDGPRSCIGAR